MLTDRRIEELIAKMRLSSEGNRCDPWYGLQWLARAVEAEAREDADECIKEQEDLLRELRAERDEARQAALEAAAKVCEPIICGSQGFAGPSCCVAEHGHEGPHRYGEPRPMTARECAAAIRALKEGRG